MVFTGLSPAFHQDLDDLEAGFLGVGFWLPLILDLKTRKHVGIYPLVI